MSNVHKFREPIMAPEFLRIDGEAVGGGADLPTLDPGADGDTVTISAPGLVKLSITFDVAATVLSTADFATFELCERPNSNLLILATRLNLTGTKTQTNAVAIGVGSQAMTSSTLSGALVDVLTSSGSLNNGATAVTYDSNGADDGSSAPPRVITADADEHFHLNVQHIVNSNSDITLAGTLEITYLDMGGPAAS